MPSATANSQAAAPTNSKPVETATADERAAAGKAAREKVSRASHGDWEPAARRKDPVKLLEDQAKSRVQELVPIRYGRMLASPFTFYRGAAAIMAMDLAKTPESGIEVQLCGDAHLSNFGVFAAPDRRLVLDVNDFDETLPGPWEWDVKRLAASFEIAGRDRDFTPKETRRAVLRTVRSYREAMRNLATMRNFDVWYTRLDVDTLLADLAKVADRKQMKAAQKNVAKAGKKNSLRAFDRLVHEVDGEPRIISDPPLLVPAGELVSKDQQQALEERIIEMLGRYRESLKGDRRHLFDSFRFVEMARKVVGVGSVGTRAWVVLMMGRDGQDPLFLQAKEAEASVLEPYVGESDFGNHGERVVEGQWLMQAASDVLLGWLPAIGFDGGQRDFYVRQLWDGKRSVEVEALSPEGLEIYGQMCGWTLARAHARSGDRIAIGAYLGKNDSFDQAIAEFSERYADQNELDYAALADAAKSGRIEVETDLD
ncbi:MAG TPA: DUF2252 domain-containing protein [Solirubrobacterales bacterium]|nr:DUF2252 domain-containing protein [Solirubrobacterales bacterium]